MCASLISLLLGRGAPLDSAVTFVDKTEQSGIDFVHNSAPDKKYIVESMSGGVALFDFDRDGWLDLYLVNSLTVDTADQPQSSKSHLYRNRGDGTFQDVTDSAGVGYPGWGMGVCAGDYDSDGWLDLYVTALGPNKLFRNNGNGTFSEKAAALGVADERWSTGCGFSDYDGDGDFDLFVANYVDFKLDSLPEFGKGATCQYRGIPVQCGPRGLAGAGDILYRNDGDRFTDVSQTAGVSDPEGHYGLGIIWSDLDEDGHPDLFVANDSRPNLLYRNRGDGTFEEIGFLSGTAVGEDGSEQGCMGVAVGDYDNDRDLDFFVSNFSDEYNAFYRHDRDFLFTEVSFATRTAQSSFPFVGWGTEFFDYDNDGWLDLLVGNGHVYPQVDNAGLGIKYAQRKLLYHNDGDGTFTEVAEIHGAPLLKERVSRGIAFGDTDNDGDVDFVVNDLDGAASLIINEGGNRKNWITLQLVGPASNPFALGSRVVLAAGTLNRLAEVRSGSSYLSQNDLRLHFGLGGIETIDSIKVLWPDGSRSELKEIPANQFLKIESGQGS